MLNLYIAEKSSSHSDKTQNHHKSSGKVFSSSSKTSSSLTDQDSEETDPSRVKTLCDSPDHISAKLNQRMLSADQTSSVASSAAADDSSYSNSAESAPLSTASQRPKTVKTLGSKMRSTGKWPASCQTFPHAVVLFCCRFPVMLLCVLQNLYQLSDAVCNLGLLWLIKEFLQSPEYFENVSL